MMEGDRDKDAETQQTRLRFIEVDRMKPSRNENLTKTFGTCHFYASAPQPPISIYLPYQLYSAYIWKCHSRKGCIHLKHAQHTSIIHKHDAK